PPGRGGFDLCAAEGLHPGGLQRSAVLTRIDRKALPIAIAWLLVLCASASASALTITGLGGGLGSTTYQLSPRHLSLSWSQGDGGDGDYSHYPSSLSGYLTNGRDDSATAPVPEPSSALVFGLGLLAAVRFARRKR